MRKTAAAAALLLCSAFGADASTLSDGTFANSDWSLAIFSNSGSSVSAQQQSSGGNPDAYRQVVDSVNSAGGSVPYSEVIGASIYQPVTYNPLLQGPLALLNYSIDSFCGDSCGGEGQLVAFAVEQGGQVFWSADSDFITGSLGIWKTTTASGLTASDFGLASSILDYDPTIHPDFSASGGILNFGFITGNSTPSSGYSITARFDNFAVNVPVLAVPEPPTWAVMLAGLLGLAGFAVYRRRKQSIADLSA
jgi:hypothetical protein